MSSSGFSILFSVFLLMVLTVRFWLASRQIRHVAAHRNAVPSGFDQKIPLEAHQKAADYTIAKTRLGINLLLFNTAVLIGFTLLGGLQWLSVSVLGLAGGGMTYQLG